MHVILFLLAMFVPAVCFSQTLDIEKYEIRQEKAIIPLLIGAALVAVAVGIYTFLQMRKMQKKNQPKPNQLDGTIADEGTSFCDIAGSPHVHANITDIWGKSTQAIKKKSGGFLGIGSSSQTTGYRYYAKFAAFIGNRIEKFIGINFDNRKWILHDPKYYGPNFLQIYEPNLFGENEGGVAGVIDIHTGLPEPEPNPTYQQYFPLVSGYPYQSYLVFRGFSDPIDGQAYAAPAKSSFYLGNSGYMKEMLLWVKRTRVRNDGQGQWYASTESRPWVCEIGQYKTSVHTGSISIGNKVISTICTYETQLVGGLKPDVTDSFSVLFQGLQDTIVYTSSLNDNNNVMDGVWNAQDIGKDIKSTYKRKFHTSGLSGFLKISFEVIVYGEDFKINPIGRVISVTRDLIGYYKEDFFDDARIYLVEVVYHASEPIIGIEVVARRTEADWNQPVFAGDQRFTIYDLVNSFIDAESPDINPIHKIREILTDDTAMAKPEIDVNDVNFIKAADRIWDEGLGVSWAVDEKSCLDAIEELCYHMEAGIRVNRQTGLYEMVLFRDDWFAEDEIHSITENKIKDLSLEVMNSDDIVNQLNVTYYDRERIKNSTFSVYENGSILTMGYANAESIEFPYFMNMRNAEIVANWKLKQFSTPAWSGSFTTGWREARKWNRYDLIRLPWSKKWNGTILARIMKINLGNGVDNTVTIDFEEVIPYSGEMNTSIIVDDPIDAAPQAPHPATFRTFEIPYYNLVQLKTQTALDLELVKNPDVGFVGAVAGKSQQNSINAQLHTESSVGYEFVSTVEYASFARIEQPINRLQESFILKNEDLSIQFRPDSLIMIDEEIMIYKSYDAETKTLTVERGALDTIPKNHIANTVLYFYEDAFAYDSEEYVPPKTVNMTVLTTTPSGIESLETSPKRQVEIESRAIRPYPPANVKFNDAYYPETLITTNDIVLAWSSRNRLLNQITDFYDSSSDAESGTTYAYELTSESIILDSASGITLNTATILASVLAPNKPHTLRLWSMRDGYDSYQVFEHSFFVESASLILTASTDGSSVTGNTVPTASISVNVDESLSANMQFDGSSISGKAEPGAIITIEIQE